MEINEITQERLAEKFKSALKREGLLYKDVAPKFYTSASTLGDMMSGRAPGELQEWSMVRDWDISGKSLRDYKVPLEYKYGFMCMAIEMITKLHKRESSEPIVKSISNVNAEKNMAALDAMIDHMIDLQKKSKKLAIKKHKKELAAAIAKSITTEDGKTTIDVAELNQRTGTRVTVDILEGGYIITVTNLPK